MKVLLFFDQTQAGKGGKNNPGLELGVDKGGIGAALMFEKDLASVGGQIVGTMYCGEGYFFEHESEVVTKIVKLVSKVKPDVLLCGPCYNYPGYAKMACIVASAISKETLTKPIVMLSEENKEVIEEYKNTLPLVKMPKKGGTGLSQSFKDMSLIAQELTGDGCIKSKSVIF